MHDQPALFESAPIPRCLVRGLIIMAADIGVTITDGATDDCGLWFASKCEHPESDWEHCPKRRKIAGGR
jgi:hypothetical protein